MDAEPPLIVVVEDDAAIAAVEREVLEEEGYRAAVLPAPTPADVVALGPDLVLLDVVLGGVGNGRHLLRALKADPAARAIPVLVVTALSGPALDALRAELAAWDCRLLPKPFDLDELIAAVRACLADARERAAS
jgi:DNA-binding response OmpR family regulator